MYRRTWKRYSNGTGGDAITFLQEFCGKDFREAVNYLLEFNGGRARDSPIPHPKPVQKKEKPDMIPPSDKEAAAVSVCGSGAEYPASEQAFERLRETEIGWWTKKRRMLCAAFFG